MVNYDSKRLEDSIKKYEAKTGETVEAWPDMAVKIIGNEFMIWKLALREGVPFFWIDQVFAKDFSVFYPFIREVCATAGIERIVTATTRDPKAHMRKWKMERLPRYDYEFEGRRYLVLKGHISNLKG